MHPKEEPLLLDLYSQVNSITINTRLKTIGKYTSDRGMLSSINQRVTDSLFYQDYSYVVRSRTPISEWRNAVKDTTHPAGFKVFGELYLESEASAEMQPKQQVAQHLTSYIISSKGACHFTINQKVYHYFRCKGRRYQSC